jgi:hypothetical protein
MQFCLLFAKRYIAAAAPCLRGRKALQALPEALADYLLNRTF